MAEGDGGALGRFATSAPVVPASASNAPPHKKFLDPPLLRNEAVELSIDLLRKEC